MIIDCHCHVFPETIAAKAIAKLEKNSGLKAVTDGSLTGLLRSMEQWGIDYACVLPVATKPEQQKKINIGAAAINGGKIIAFGSVFPGAADMIEQLRKIKSLGLHGIKIHPQYQHVNIDDDCIVELAIEAGRLDLPIVFHAGVDPGIEPPLYATPQATARLLSKLAGVNPFPCLIAAHMGGYLLWDDVERYLVGKNIYFDTGFMAMDMPKEQAKRIIDNHGADKILFASDCPWCTGAATIDYIRALGLSDQEKAKIFYDNAAALLHLQPESGVQVDQIKFGGGNFTVIAGPCAIESEQQITSTAVAVAKSGAVMLRGGAFKPRSSPYVFQGLRKNGIELLIKAKQLSGLPVVTEITDIRQLPLFDQVDMIQVGARNMQNFELLRELGCQPKPVLLKRGQSATIRELLLSAEYIMAGGNQQIVLCERGIRTFETETRNTLDIAAVPLLKRLSQLPVIVDPSHACGDANLIKPLALAAVAAGADGLLIEVHNDPAAALCDGNQSLSPVAFAELMIDIKLLIGAKR